MGESSTPDGVDGVTEACFQFPDLRRKCSGRPIRGVETIHFIICQANRLNATKHIEEKHCGILTQQCVHAVVTIVT